MQPFTMKAPCRLEEGKRVWDTPTSQWTNLKPRLIQNPPQTFTPEQTEYIQARTEMLVEHVRVNKRMRDDEEERKAAGPLDFIYYHHEILEREGFHLIEDTAPVRQLTRYLWDLVDRYNTRGMEWHEFEDQVEQWYLVLSDKIVRHKERTGVPRA